MTARSASSPGGAGWHPRCPRRPVSTRVRRFCRSTASSRTTGLFPALAPKCTSDSFSTSASPLRTMTTFGPVTDVDGPVGAGDLHRSGHDVVRQHARADRRELRALVEVHGQLRTGSDHHLLERERLARCVQRVGGAVHGALDRLLRRGCRVGRVRRQHEPEAARRDHERPRQRTRGAPANRSDGRVHPSPPGCRPWLERGNDSTDGFPTIGR